MSRQIIEFDHQNDTRIAKSQLKTSSPQRRQTPQEVHDDILDKFSDYLHDFFSKGWNVFRFCFFIAFSLIVMYVLISAISSVPEGKSFTWGHFVGQIFSNLEYLRDNFPILGTIFRKISDLVSARQVNFLIFMSALFGTICLLICLCP